MSLEDDLDEDQLPKVLTPEQRATINRLMKKEGNSQAQHNGEMLNDSKKARNERVHDLFRVQKISPLTELVLLCKIERTKVYLYEKTLMEGGDVSFLPKPDKKLYVQLLKDLAAYEVPNLKSIDITGKVDIGMSIRLVQFAPEQKIIELDDESPDKLKFAGNVARLPGNTVGLVDKEIAKVIEEAIYE